MPAEARRALRSGLCGGCRHAEVVRSKRSAFLRCALADRDPRFPRYPALPVVACAGFATAGDDGADPDARRGGAGFEKLE